MSHPITYPKDLPMKLLIILIFNSVLFSEVVAAGKLKGSLEAQKRQNLQADVEGLERLSETQLDEYKRLKKLIPLSEIPDIAIDSRLPEKYRWCLPQTNIFLVNLVSDFKKKFGRTIKVNSAVRTFEFQTESTSVNKNAAPAELGPRQSSHLTGATVDIGKFGLSEDELRWLRKYFIDLEEKGLIEATEEHFQSVFHIMVFRQYAEN